MLKDLNDASRSLLSLIQKGFPLEERPFISLATQTGLKEAEALSHMRQLKEKGFIVEISGIFNAAALGYTTTLVAMKIDPEELDKAARIISLHPGVGHNYSRDSSYNLWFTLSIPRTKDLPQEVIRLQNRAGALSSLILPSLRLFKIGVFIQPGKHGEDARIEGMDGEGGAGEMTGEISHHDELEPNGYITQEEMTVVRGLQRDLSLELNLEPFKHLAESSDMEEGAFLAISGRLLERKIMRRYAAQLPHRHLGFTFNAMVCWKAPQERKIAIGKALASSPWVTHCYERPPCEDWPYNLYSMVHGKTREECQEKARNLSKQVSLEEYVLLFSPKEYKKARVKYFLEKEE